MIPEYLRWLKFWAADKKARESCEIGPMKTKGFTLIELVVACTVLLILSTLATTSVDNLVQAFKDLQATNQTVTYRNQVWTLKFMLTQAQLTYAATITDPTAVVSVWNTKVTENDSVDLIPQLGPSFPIPGITNYTSLLQVEKMYDPTGATNPTIQLGTFTATTPVTLSSLPTVTWRGISL
jgi:prepilin-type N-terminal cleavage/methylation domain-containing protein